MFSSHNSLTAVVKYVVGFLLHAFTEFVAFTLAASFAATAAVSVSVS